MDPIGLRSHFKGYVGHHLYAKGMLLVRQIVLGRSDKQAVGLLLLHHNRRSKASVGLLERNLSLAVVIRFVGGNAESSLFGTEALGTCILEPFLARIIHAYSIGNVLLDFYFKGLGGVGQFYARGRDNQPQSRLLTHLDGLRQLIGLDGNGGRSVVVSAVGLAGKRHGNGGIGGRSRSRRGFAPGLR